MHQLYRLVIHNLIISLTPLKEINGKRQRKCKTMMRKQVENKKQLKTLDLTVIEGDGSFPCPRCGTIISPDDETEDVYKILDTKIVGNELAELVISCSTCGTIIKLTGFQAEIDV
jgi:predicted RNA-binding Zn-ribbon protein involved in translation (DUF1610 family)